MASINEFSLIFLANELVCTSNNLQGDLSRVIDGFYAVNTPQTAITCGETLKTRDPQIL